MQLKLTIMVPIVPITRPTEYYGRLPCMTRDMRSEAFRISLWLVEPSWFKVYRRVQDLRFRG